VADPSPQIITWEPDVAPLLAAYAKLNEASAKQVVAVKNEAKAAEAASKAAAKAKADEEKAFAKAVDDELKAAEKANAKEMADAKKKADYLIRLQIQSAKDAAKAAEREARGPSAWTLALQANTKALAEQHSAINKAREATGALGAAISTLSPELGAMVGTLQKLEGAAGAAAGGAEVLGTSLATVGTAMGAVAVAAVPAYLAWEQSTEDLAELDKWVKITTADLDAMEKGVGSIVEAQNELDKRQQKLRGSMTEAEAATYAEADAQKVYQGELAATGDALDHATERLKEMKRRAYDKSFFEFLGDSFNPFSQGLDDATRAIKQQEKEVERLKGNIKGLKGDQETYAGTLAKVTLEEERATGAKASRAKATADSNAALKAEIDLLLAAEKAEADHYAAIHKAVDALDKQAATARKASQSETERIEAERQAALEIADSIARTALMEAQTADERRDIDRALAADRVAINQQADEAITTAQLAALEKRRQAERDEAAATTALREKAKDDAIAAANATLDAISGLLDADIETKRAAAEKGNKQAQKAILKEWKAQQAIAYGEVALNTIAAASKAAASAPPPFNIPGILAATATGAGQLAAVASQKPPSFDDTPGVQGGPGSGGSARQVVSLHQDDFFAASKTQAGLLSQILGATMGNRGRSAGGGPLLVRNEAMLARNAAGAYGEDVFRILRGGGY